MTVVFKKCALEVSTGPIWRTWNQMAQRNLFPEPTGPNLKIWVPNQNGSVKMEIG